MDVVQERNQNNVTTAIYARTGNIGGILARTMSAGSVFCFCDGGGNVTTLTNSAGAQVGSYAYNALRNTAATSGRAARRARISIASRLKTTALGRVSSFVILAARAVD